MTDRNDEWLRTATIQLIQSFRARAPAAIPDFVSSHFRDKERPRIPSAARYLDCSSRTFREAAIYPESYPRSFIVSGKEDVSCYRFQKRDSRDTFSENSRQVIVRTVLQFLQSFLIL